MLPGSAAGQRPLSASEFPRIDRIEVRQTVPFRVSWRSRDVALASGFTAALLVDAAQTRRFARTGWRDSRETNPLLGPRPSVGRVNTYTAVVGLAVLGVAAVAPKRARPWVLGVALAVEMCTLAAMAQRGIAITF